MELFVVNRHNYDYDEKTKSDEQNKLDKVLKRIEKNKKARQKLKEKKQLNKICKEDSSSKRIEKKKTHRAIVHVPDPDAPDEFIDENITKCKIAENEEHTDSIKPQLDVALQDFTILGGDNFDKKTKVKRVLPKWLSTPRVISVNLQNLQTKVKDIKLLDASIKKKLKENGIKYFFPVQVEVIPWILKTNKHSNIIFPRDICVSAPTGSGKTLAFVLPVIQALKYHTVRKIRALVILPTQGLANQVHKTFKTYSQDTNLIVSLTTGKNSFINEQKQLVAVNEAFGYLSKVDILVCTAGRLVDHIKVTQGFSLQNLEFLIIDEADRVLETVQNDWLYHLEKHIHQDEPPSSKILNLFTFRKHRPPQKLLFSATLSQDPEKLQKLSLFQPKLFTSVVENVSGENTEKQNAETFIGKYTTPNELTEKFIICTMQLKPLVLFEFIRKEKLTRTMVFTNTIESTHRLSLLLKLMFKESMKIEGISSSLEPKDRDILINQFEKGSIDVLVCTDSLARGIDLPGVQCVISYSAPKYIKTYIHRAGRTARAGEPGLAVTLLHTSQLAKFQNLLQQAGKTNLEEIKIEEEELESLGSQYKEALEGLEKEVHKEGEVKLKKIKLAKRAIPKKSNNEAKRKRKNSVGSNNGFKSV